MHPLYTKQHPDEPVNDLKWTGPLSSKESEDHNNLDSKLSPEMQREEGASEDLNLKVSWTATEVATKKKYPTEKTESDKRQRDVM